MQLIIVHYHLRPGGIRRVIELATPHLVRAHGAITQVQLLTGEAAAAHWNQSFQKQLAPVPVQVSMRPELGYLAEQHQRSASIRKRIAAALRSVLNQRDRSNCIVWAHNLGIGRNLLLAAELARACAERDIPLLAHHHDWWFDNRWARWPQMARAGFRTQRAVAKAIFSAAPNVRHAAINAEEAHLLQRHTSTPTAWLPNLAQRPATPSAATVQRARRWLQRTLGERQAPVWILPCRLLRRKNLAEAWLLTRWLRPEAWLVTTGGVSSAEELPYFQTLQAAAAKHGWRLRLGILHGASAKAPGIPDLLAASEAVLLTSIQEGFGLPYLEAAAAQRPLVARTLPNIAPDLRQFGFRFPQSYAELQVATELFDWDAEQRRQRELFTTWRALLPANVRQLVATPELLRFQRAPRRVAFSRLTLSAQLEVLAQPPDVSWSRCAPWNPFLTTWRKRAAAGRLQVTAWPRGAERWLSGDAYAQRWLALAQAPDKTPAPTEATRVQAALLQKKLCAANLYPLLWAQES